MIKANLYPHLQISLIKDPNRFYALPLLGGIVKWFMLIPVFIELFALGIVSFFMLVIGSFVILFTGKYWQAEYEYFLGYMRLQAKVSFFFAGLTNTYPGFSLSATEFELDIPRPSNPNRWFATPILGFLVRIILLIPFSIYSSVIQLAGTIAILFSWVTVLLFGTYPETTYELVRDRTRLSFAVTSYVAGFSDTYPNFWISLNHKKLKIILIVIAVILMFLRFTSVHHTPKTQQYKYNYSSNTAY